MGIITINLDLKQLKFFSKKSEYNRSSYIRKLIINSKEYKEWEEGEHKICQKM